MWLIAETIQDFKLEYWSENGQCKLSLLTDATTAAELDKLKEQLNALKVRPPDATFL